MASNPELSEIKLLLQSLAAGLKAVKSDVADLKKHQTQSQQSTSTCAKCADSGIKASNVEKALGDTETKLMAKIRDTESAVLQLVEEEKVLIHAEVVQLSRTVGTALEDAKGKMLEKVAEVVDANDRKRSRSTAGLDGDNGVDVANKRIKQEEEGVNNDQAADDNNACSSMRKKFVSQFDRGIISLMDRTAEALHEYRGDVEPEWLFVALDPFYAQADDSRIGFWNDFQTKGKIDFDYCLYGLFYFGHEHSEVASGKCFCRVEVTPTFMQRATKCIRALRDADDPNRLLFLWGEDIGPPIPIVAARQVLENPEH